MDKYQRGSLRVEQRRAGPTWVLRYGATRVSDGRRVERTAPVGLVSVIGKSTSAAWREVDRLRLSAKINEAYPNLAAPTFSAIADSYLAHEVERLAFTSRYVAEHVIRDFLVPRWGKHIAVDIQPLEVEMWLKSLNEDGRSKPTTAKLKEIMHRVYKHAQRAGLITRNAEGNPIAFVRASAKSDYKAILISPEQAFAIIQELQDPAKTLAILSAATGLRISESLGLQWQDIDFVGQKISVRRTWLQGQVGTPKTAASQAAVPMNPLLAEAMRNWRSETPYSKDTDWVFASARRNGKQPREGNMLAADHLRPAAVKVGVLPKNSKMRFGWHNFRHSLASFLVGQGTNAKTVQELLRHAKVQTTLDLYSQSNTGSRMAAQSVMLNAILKPELGQTA